MSLEAGKCTLDRRANKLRYGCGCTLSYVGVIDYITNLSINVCVYFTSLK